MRKNLRAIEHEGAIFILAPGELTAKLSLVLMRTNNQSGNVHIDSAVRLHSTGV